MKKPVNKNPARVVPAFAKEGDEAKWWYKNRAKHSRQALDASKKGEGEVLTRKVLLERIEASKARGTKTASPVISLRIPEADLLLARKQAEKKGLPYQTYIKSLLHETLVAREVRRGSGSRPS